MKATSFRCAVGTRARKRAASTYDSACADDIKTILPELKRVNKFAIQQKKEMDKLIRFDADKYMEELEKEPQLKVEDLPVI